MFARRNGENYEPSKTFDGLGFDNFALKSHALLRDVEAIAGDKLIQQDWLPLSKELDVYIACAESVIRSKDGRLEFWGNVFLISGEKIQKLEESLGQL